MEWSATAGGGWNIKPCPSGARGMLFVQLVSLARRKSIRVVTPPCNLHLTCRIKFRPARHRAFSSSVVSASEQDLGGQTARSRKRAFFTFLRLQCYENPFF